MECPKFDARLVLSGLKVLGKEAVDKWIEVTGEGLKLSNKVIGFDLVNEEDFTDPLTSYLKEIYAAKRKDPDQNFPCYFHCGESPSRLNQNLFDAIILGTKRIGHGFNILLHPQLQEIVKKEKICIECCPISNYVLGYVNDLRHHPVRYLLTKGLPVSISSDDPGFWDYEGTSLDFTWAYLAWDLDLADIKKLALNSIEYSSISEDEKKQQFGYFDADWKDFISNCLKNF